MLSEKKNVTELKTDTWPLKGQDAEQQSFKVLGNVTHKASSLGCHYCDKSQLQ